MKKDFLLLLMFFIVGAGQAFSQTVYITKTGKKYHVQTCRYLNRSSIPISLADARAAGYTPCSICDPPVKATSTNSESTDSRMTVPPRRAISVQCSAKTKSGTRCKRMTKSPNGLCWQHGGD
jgi:hypothetical protein